MTDDDESKKLEVQTMAYGAITAEDPAVKILQLSIKLLTDAVYQNHVISTISQYSQYVHKFNSDTEELVRTYPSIPKAVLDTIWSQTN